jgi:hypothetical protein
MLKLHVPDVNIVGHCLPEHDRKIVAQISIHK